ncbi:T9SS type A sorting domain-containing protein [Fluviicola taffensis]|uniref:T9SS type A sorting domain-containing protein n=1 Tax=Fluviicola taffensis TaxID=191579 RepID=UPI003138171F
MAKYLLFFFVSFWHLVSYANDECVNAVTLTPSAACNYTTGSFSGMTISSTAPSCGASSIQDVWYTFTATDSTMRISLSSQSGLNHGFQIIQGSCNGTVLQCVNANTTGISESYFNNDFIPGQVYYVRVFNASGALSTLTFGICVQTYPVPANDVCSNAVILTPSSTCNYTAGTFSGAMMNGGAPACGASSQQDLWYRFTATDSTMRIFLSSESGLNHGFQIIQGSCNGTVLQCVNSNATGISESYFNNDFIPGQVYYVRVFNASGALSTLTFGICVQTYPVPANDVCSNAVILTPSSTCNYTAGTFSGAMMNGGAPACGASSQQDLWYRFTATDSTMRIFLSSESGLNHGFQIIQGSCNGTVLQCVNSNATGISESYFNNDFIPGQVYYVRVFNASGALSTLSFGICVQTYPVPVNNVCADAIELTPASSCSYTTGTFSGAMMNGGTLSCAPNASQDVWYKFTATSSNMGIQLSSVSGLNHGFQVFEGSCNGTEVTCMNNFTSSIGESASFTTLTVGNTYFIRVVNTASGLNTSNFGICLTGPPPASCTPAIAINTSTTTICQGESVVFNATPTHGGTSPSFQWKVNGSNVGTNSSSYTTTTLTNGSVVSCVMVSNASCASPTSATSNSITMNVTASVTPTFTPVSAICSGESFTLPAVSNNGFSGTWSPAINNTATTTYTFMPTGGQCVSNATMTVSVNNPATPSFTQIAAICSGGSFTLPATSNNGINGSWSPAIDNTQTTTYTFTPNAGQCASTTTMMVTVNSTSTNPTFTQVPTICSGESFTLPTTSNNGIVGSWSPALNNTTTTTYTFTPNAGQCATTTTMTVTVNSTSVTPTFTPVSAICSGDSFTLPTTSNNGFNGLWSPAINTTATTTYTFTPNAGQCASTTTMTVTVNNSITPSFTPIVAICSGESLTLPTMSNNGISGTWSPAVNNTATTTYTFTPSSGQCVETVTMTVVVNSVNTATTIQGIMITASATGATYQWINCANNQPINGATNASFTPTANGSYAVIVTQNGCSDTSSCVAITTVGMEALVQNGWNIYPNPASDHLFVESNEATEIVIKDITGKTMQVESLKSGNNLIHLTSLSRGVYFIQSASGATVKFVKE